MESVRLTVTLAWTPPTPATTLSSSGALPLPEDWSGFGLGLEVVDSLAGAAPWGSATGAGLGSRRMMPIASLSSSL